MPILVDHSLLVHFNTIPKSNNNSDNYYFANDCIKYYHD